MLMFSANMRYTGRVPLNVGEVVDGNLRSTHYTLAHPDLFV